MYTGVCLSQVMQSLSKTLLGMALRTLQEDNMYKYLGFIESASLQHGIRSKLREDCGKRLDAIFGGGGGW